MFIDGAADKESESKEQLLGHSSEYTAWKLRKQAERDAAREKRRREVEEERDDKRAKKMEEMQKAMETARNGLLEKTMTVWAEEMGKSVKELEKVLEGEV